jgi:hypothetical protein
MVWQAWQGEARPGSARSGVARPGVAWFGRHGTAWRGEAGLGPAWLGTARHGVVRRGLARRGMAWFGRHGVAGRGGARQGWARPGQAWRGMVSAGNNSRHSFFRRRRWRPWQAMRTAVREVLTPPRRGRDSIFINGCMQPLRSLPRAAGVTRRRPRSAAPSAPRSPRPTSPIGDADSIPTSLPQTHGQHPAAAAERHMSARRPGCPRRCRNGSDRQRPTFTPLRAVAASWAGCRRQEVGKAREVVVPRSGEANTSLSN